MNTKKLSLIAAALMLFSLFAVSAMAAYGDYKGMGDQDKDRDGSCDGAYCLNDGICDNFVDEDGDGSCDNCPNDGVCDGTGPRGAGNGQGAGNGAGDQIHARDGSCTSEE